MTNKVEVTIEAIIHATENESKFFEIFEGMFDIDEKKFSKENLTGHFKNPITLLRTKITKKDAPIIVKKLVEGIPKEQLDEVIVDLENRIDSSGVYLRLDKQEFVKGKLVLEEKNSIKVKIYTPVYTKKDSVKIYADLFRSTN